MKTEDLEFNYEEVPTVDGTLIFLPTSSKSVAAIEFKGISPRTPVRKNYFQFDNIAHYGLDNLYPQNFIKAVSVNPIVLSTIRKQAEILVCGQLSYAIDDFDQQGEAIKIRKKNKDLEAWKKNNKISQNIIDFAYDYYLFNSMYGVFYLNEKRQITRIKHYPALQCRLGLQNEQTGKPDKLYISANWDLFDNSTTPETLSFPLLDLEEPFESMDELKYGEHYAYAFCKNAKVLNIDGYYPLVEWHSFLHSGLNQLTIDTIKTKKTKIARSMHTDRQVSVHNYFWKNRYKDWDEKKGLQEERRKEVLQMFHNQLTSPDNAGVPFMSSRFLDPKTNEETEMIKIIPLQNPNTDGEYLKDLAEANKNFLFSIGMPHRLIGDAPGSGSNGTGGTATREEFNIYLTCASTLQEKILDPYNFANDYHGFEEQFFLHNPTLQTLDKITSANRQVANATNVAGGEKTNPLKNLWQKYFFR